MQYYKKYCRNCIHFHNAERTDPVKSLKKYNKWCCANGTPIAKVIGWCKLNKKYKKKGDNRCNIILK